MTNGFLSCEDDNFKEQNETADLNNLTDNNFITIGGDLEIDPEDCNVLLGLDIFCGGGTSSASISLHNNLFGLQGGTETARYHLTPDEWEAVQGASAPSAANPFLTNLDVPDPTWANIIGKPNGGNFVFVNPSVIQPGSIYMSGVIQGQTLRAGDAAINMDISGYNNTLYGNTLIRASGALTIESGDNSFLTFQSGSAANGNTGNWAVGYHSSVDGAPFVWLRNGTQIARLTQQDFTVKGRAYFDHSVKVNNGTPPNVNDGRELELHASGFRVRGRTGDGEFLTGLNLGRTGTLDVSAYFVINVDGIFNSSWGNYKNLIHHATVIGVSGDDNPRKMLDIRGDGIFNGSVEASSLWANGSVTGHRLVAYNSSVTGSISTYIDNGAAAFEIYSSPTDFAQIRYQPNTLVDDAKGRPRLWINRGGGSGNVGVIAYTDDITDAMNGFILANTTNPENASINLNAGHFRTTFQGNSVTYNTFGMTNDIGYNVNVNSQGVTLNGADIKFISAGVLLGRVGNGSNGPLTEFAHMMVTKVPTEPTEVVRLVDLAGRARLVGGNDFTGGHTSFSGGTFTVNTGILTANSGFRVINNPAYFVGSSINFAQDNSYTKNISIKSPDTVWTGTHTLIAPAKSGTLATLDDITAAEGVALHPTSPQAGSPNITGVFIVGDQDRSASVYNTGVHLTESYTGYFQRTEYGRNGIGYREGTTPSDGTTFLFEFPSRSGKLALLGDAAKFDIITPPTHSDYPIARGGIFLRLDNEPSQPVKTLTFPYAGSFMGEIIKIHTFNTDNPRWIPSSNAVDSLGYTFVNFLPNNGNRYWEFISNGVQWICTTGQTGSQPT